MEVSPTKIVVIHDGLILTDDPLLVMLKEEFGEENVVHKTHSNEGLTYVLDNLTQRMIVLVDINFSKGEKSGIQVFHEIRAKTSLVYIIMITARSLAEITNTDLISMVNHDAFAIENVANYPQIIELAKSAGHKLEVRVDSVLEEWIMKHPPEIRTQPLIKTKEGKEYSMNEVLESIRQQTEIGQSFEKNLLKLAIEIFSRQKLKTDD